MLFESIEEYTEEIADVRADIKRIRKIGIEHYNDSGGSSRRTKEVELSQLFAYLSQLQREMKILDNSNASNSVRIGSGW